MPIVSLGFGGTSTLARRRAVSGSTSLVCTGTRRSSSTAKIRQIIGECVCMAVYREANLDIRPINLVAKRVDEHRQIDQSTQMEQLHLCEAVVQLHMQDVVHDAVRRRKNRECHSIRRHGSRAT